MNTAAGQVWAMYRVAHLHALPHWCCTCLLLRIEDDTWHGLVLDSEDLSDVLMTEISITHRTNMERGTYSGTLMWKRVS